MFSRWLWNVFETWRSRRMMIVVKKLADQNGSEEEKNLRALIRVESDLDELRADTLYIDKFKTFWKNFFTGCF